MYAITGASGNVGKVVANTLLASEKNVFVIGRNADKLESLVVKGAVPMVGDLMDASFVKKAFEGMTAVFCIIPLNPHSQDPRAEQQTIAKNYIDAVVENEIHHVILLSSAGAHLRNGTGLIDGLADLEVYFSELKAVNVLALRPVYFMENTLTQVNVIKHMGTMGSPLKGDLKIPMVAAKDIGTLAARRLLDLKFQGHTVEYITGQRDISYNEIAGIIGNKIEMPDLKYVQFSYQDFKTNMVQSGYVSENVAEQINIMTEGINNGKINSDFRRTPENSSPTSYEEFSSDFTNVFNSVLAEH